MQDSQGKLASLASAATSLSAAAAAASMGLAAPAGSLPAEQALQEILELLRELVALEALAATLSLRQQASFQLSVCQCELLKGLGALAGSLLAEQALQDILELLRELVALESLAATLSLRQQVQAKAGDGRSTTYCSFPQAERLRLLHCLLQSSVKF